MSKNIKTNDGIVYSGSVHIQYRFEKKTRHINRHNQGFLPLFTSIVLSLGDKTVEAKSYMPRYIMAKNAVDEPCLSNKVLFQGRKYYKDGAIVDATLADTIRYSFVIPVSSMIVGKKIKKLQLMNERDELCAQIVLEAGSEISTDLGANLLIYWILTFADAAQ